MMDVVIIGGGPAGITAGVVLQKSGYRTCIVDTQIFPRPKLCAGVVTTKSVKLIQHIYNGLDINDLNINYIDKISMFYKDEIIGKYTVENKYGVVNRMEFDNTLLNYYKSVGGMVLDGQKKYQIYYDKSLIDLCNGEKIEYRYLIGADGINSRVRTYVQRNWKTSILCFEEFIPNDLQENTIEIYFGKMLGGYCWRIPYKDRVGIGLGEFYIRYWKRNIQKYYDFFKQQGVDNMESIKGAFVSSGYFVKKPVKNNVLLVGDAAGLVDAMSGEGIFFAMESGRQAALAIADCFQYNKSLSEYLKRIKRIHKRMREQSKFNKLLYVPGFQRMCMRYMKNNPCFTKSVLEDAMSSYGSGYLKVVVRNWARHIKIIKREL